MPIEAEDIVQTKLIIDAIQAIKAMNDVSDKADSYKEKLDAVIQAQRDFALGQGMKDSAAKKLFDDLISKAEFYREVLDKAAAAEIKLGGGLRLSDTDLKNQLIADMIRQDPRLMDMVNNIKSPFYGGIQGAASKDVSSQAAEINRAEQNAQKIAMSLADLEAKKVMEREKSLSLAQQELQAVEKEGSAIADQLKNYGQVRRTVQETMEYLRSFAGTQQGGGILTQFLGNYKQSQGAIQQIDSIKSAILGLSKATGASFSQAGQLIKEQFSQLPGISNQVNAAVSQLGKSFEVTGQKGKSAFEKVFSSVNALRIALGALIAMLLFQVIQAIQTTFSEAIKQATQFEETLYRLRNVEQSLSMEGIEISMKGLKKGIMDIQKLLPIFSKEDVSQLVGTLAISTKQLGLNEQQILDLAKAIGILNIRSEKQEDLSTTAQHVLSSLLTGNAKGITALGIAFTDNVMKAKAMELGFLDAGEAISTLTENEKGLTKLGIVLESTGQELGNVGEYLNSNAAKLQENKAAWMDLLTTVGQIILPFIPALTKFFDLINDGFKGGKVLIIEYITALSTLGIITTAVVTGQVEILSKLPELISKIREDLVNRFFKEVPDDAPEWFMKGWGHLIKEEAETATSGIDTFGEAIEDAFDSDEFGNKIEDILEDLENAREDLAEKFNQKKDDIDLEYIRKQADAERDLARKIEDINRDAERDIANLKEKQREDDLRAEEDYQNKLWELRMRYLLNLEDALHARDARQVIRLQREYEIDKEALERKKGMDDKQREEDQSNALEDIEIKRQERLADAQREFQEKLADQRLAKQRELDDLNVWYAREQADLEQSIQRKLEALIKGWIDEKKITEANAAEVYGILLKYFGPGGLTDGLAQYMFTQLGQAAMMLGQIGNMMGGTYAPRDVPRPLTNGGSSGGRSGRAGRGMAEGGTLLATRPTNVTFGEAGAEMATFTPLGRVGRNQGKVFGNSNGGMDGKILVELFLSPDLEARIIDASMDSVGEIITRVTRSKV